MGCLSLSEKTINWACSSPHLTYSPRFWDQKRSAHKWQTSTIKSNAIKFMCGWTCGLETQHMSDPGNSLLQWLKTPEPLLSVESYCMLKNCLVFFSPYLLSSCPVSSSLNTSKFLYSYCICQSVVNGRWFWPLSNRLPVFSVMLKPNLSVPVAKPSMISAM